MTMFSTAASAAELTAINPQTLFDPTSFGYSQVVIAPAGRMAHISGQGGADETGALSPDYAVQVRQAFANLKAALAGIDATPGQVARITVYIVDHDMSKLQVLTEEVIATFGKTLPAQTLVPVPRLALDGMLFEVEAVAVLDQGAE